MMTLGLANNQAQVKILQIKGSKKLTQKLTELGLNVNARVHVVNRQMGGKLIVARGEARIGISFGLAQKIVVEPIAHAVGNK